MCALITTNIGNENARFEQQSEYLNQKYEIEYLAYFPYCPY
jgi:hypothetical protein